MKFKFVTLNIWNGGRLLPAAREFLRETQADIIFIQEAYNGHGVKLEDRFKTVELLQSDFPEYTSFFAPAYCDDRAIEGPIDDGQLILSRWPLIQTENIVLDLPYASYDQDKIAANMSPAAFENFPATIQKAVIQLNHQKLTLLNVHGPVNHDGTADTPRRLHLADLILQNLGQDQAIVAGDFNVQRQTQTLRKLEKELQNVFGDELATSFNLNQKNLVKYPGYAQAAVDMVLVSSNLKVIQHVCPKVEVSDHLPLVVEFELGD